MKIFPHLIGLFLTVAIIISGYAQDRSRTEAIVIDHQCIGIDKLPVEYIDSAKQKLIIAYGHTSHGSQLISGMDPLDNFMSIKGNSKGTFNYSGSGSNNSLQLRDCPFSGAEDLGNPDRSSWANATRNYLNENPEVNVVMWSWCGQAGWASTEEIDLYLSLMNQLETDFPSVNFVYMTGHLEGTGENGQLNLNNQRIRDYCTSNHKILYDFADIESFDPDGKTNYMKLFANDNCDYTTTDNENRNWAIDWQNSHNEGVDWYECSAAHSQALVGNLKAYAAWWLFARLAGWNPDQSSSVEYPFFQNADLKVYLSGNSLHFKINPDQKIVSIKLFNMNGQTIFTEEYAITDHRTGINLAKINGMILYEVITNKQGKYTGKLMFPGP
ncbi:MAG: T9SS type A sorting domain-containing protein [Prolixibacteraceae bacterium]|nr:T9SS type A sorting domain-containing protein [Prolixibacteraceae bacterium]